MFELRETIAFAEWLSQLEDGRAKAKIAVRIQRMANGNFGDVAPVGGGVSELRIHYDPRLPGLFRPTGQKADHPVMWRRREQPA